MNAPGQEPSAQALAAFRQEAAALDVEDVLALCFTFSKDPGRLRTYLDVLRGRGGVKAQAAACLICYDLARRGNAMFEAEFMALIPVVAGWLDAPDGAGGHNLADRLVGDNPYLQELWADLRGKLAGLDDRTTGDVDGVQEVLDADTLEVSLLDEADLADLDLDILEVDDQAMAEQWQQSLERFCTFNPTGIAAPDDAPAGFFADARTDLHRVEKFRQEALSFQDGVTHARHLLPIIELFVATHTRARTLLGTRNRTRDAHVQRGLEGFFSLTEPPQDTASWLLTPSAAPFAWEKVAELLLDFMTYWASLPRNRKVLPMGELAQAYVDAGRPQPPPPILAQDPRVRRRR